MPTCPSGKGSGLENRLSEMACGFKSYRWRFPGAARQAHVDVANNLSVSRE